MIETMKIGFIGAGKVGVSLGLYFCKKNLTVVGYYSKSPQSAQTAANFTKTTYFESLESIVEASDTLFITTPDQVVEIIWDDIRKLPIKNKIICHCSGVLSSTVFSKIENYLAYGYSIHPLFAISDKTTCLEEAFFTLEGGKGHLEPLHELMKQLGNSYAVIQTVHKALYHAAAVTVSNHVLAIYEEGSKMLRTCGFQEEEVQKALLPLFYGNALNLATKGRIKALTGPIERDDQETVKKHLEVLEDKEALLYKLLANNLIAIAQRKHPDRTYATMKNLVEVKNEKYSDYF